MPACYAKNCTHRAEKGFRMFSFPSDKGRRRLWAERCGKDLSSIPKNIRLCEYHFDDSQFENHRQDGWRKLKPNAIPTIFNVGGSQISYHEIPPDDRSPIDSLEELEDIDDARNITALEDVMRSPSGVFNLSNTSRGTELDQNGLKTTHFDTSKGTIQQANEIKHLRALLLEKDEQIKDLLRKCENLKLKWKKETLLGLTYRKKLKAHERRNNLSQELERIPFFKEFATGLTSTKPKWSPQSLKLATQIRFAVGWKGYRYLRQNLQLPLPNYSTVCRHISRNDSTPGFLEDVLPLIAKKLHKDGVLLRDERDVSSD